MITKIRVGSFDFEFLSPPRGATGSVSLRTPQGTEQVDYVRDSQGLRLTFDRRSHAFDLLASRNDDGALVYQVIQRDSSQEWNAVIPLRPGQEQVAGAVAGKKKGVRVKAQMPGKIIKVLAEAGAKVERNQSIVVMEAMKMENEIRAPQAGTVTKMAISLGQAVETGAELFTIEPTEI